MLRTSLARIVRRCAIALVLGAFIHSSCVIAQVGKSTGRFSRNGVIAEITPGNITVTHDDGQQSDYSTSGLTEGQGGSVVVKGRLPLSFVSPGMVLSALVKMSPMGKIQEDVDSLTFVNDQAQELVLERTDEQGIYQVIGKVIRMTSRGMLLKVNKSPMAKQGRVELTTTDATKVAFDMRTLDRVNAEDVVESMMGSTYEGGINVISEITIELSPHRTLKTGGLSKTDQLLQKYAYLSDENTSAPRDVKLKSFNLRTDISPLQAKVLGMKLENMHEVLYRYFKKRPAERIECKIVADETNWVHESPSVSNTSTRSTAYRNVRPGGMQGTVDTGDDHDEVLRAAYEAFCKSTFSTTGPQWYCDGMSLMANYWELNDKKVSVAPEIIAHLKSSPPMSLTSVISSSNFHSDDSWKTKAGSWALCYMMIHNGNYAKDFRSLGISMMNGLRGSPSQQNSFELRFEDQMREIDFEFRQFLENFDVGYREDLCQWQWKVTPKKLFGADMIKTVVDSRAGWQATKVKVVQGQTYEYVAQGQWQTDPEFESSTADGLNGAGRLLGTIFNDYQLSETIRMSARGKFVAQTDGQLYLRCDDKWNQIEDNKGRLKVFLRKVR